MQDDDFVKTLLPEGHELVGLDDAFRRSLAPRATLPDKAEGPVGLFEVEEARTLLAAAINAMPEREKVVLTLYYYEGLTLAEIGEVLGVTESRVCQIHTKSVIHLRAKIAASEREPA